jgi:hypothetical protein
MFCRPGMARNGPKLILGLGLIAPPSSFSWFDTARPAASQTYAMQELHRFGCRACRGVTTRDEDSRTFLCLHVSR